MFTHRLKNRNVSRYLLAFLIIMVLLVTQVPHIFAAFINNLGSVALNRAVLSDLSPDEQLADFAVAGERFQRALDLDPYYGYAYYNLGTLYAHFEDSQSAFEAFTMAANTLSNDAVTLYELGSVQATLGDEAEAIASWKAAHAVSYFVNSARVYSEDGDFDSALQEAQRALRIDDQFIPAYQILGDIYTKQKEYERALHVCQTAVAIAPKDTTSLYRLGQALQRVGDTDLAVSTYQRVLTQSPDYTPALTALVSIYAAASDCEQAGSLLQTYLSPNATSRDTARVLRIVGTCYWNRDSPGYALPYLEQLAGYEIATVTDFMLLGQVYDALDRSSAAIEVYNHVLLLNPDHADAQQALETLSGEGL